ncbi:hypothetical protein EJD97_001844 [Solanum chilense]|uniref:Uncharacterized protein n=1 Tax=Solanum chilense TaxID=4083 RepID=A0A6N2BYY4_SOLCI|nr:hypothetical protein EJD97_001844 [Solanum chilense]
MVDKSGKVNIMTKTTATRLGLRYTPRNAQLRTVNEAPTQVPGVAQGEQGATLMVPMVKEPKTEGQDRLTAMQLNKNPKKEKLTFVATITSLKEDNGSKKSLPLCAKNFPRRNNVVMPKNPLRIFPPRMEVDRESKLKEIKKQLKELREGIARFNGLLVAHTRI